MRTFNYSKDPHLIGDKGMQLFRDSEIIARENTSKNEFEESMRGEHAVRIVNAICKGFEMGYRKVLSTPTSHQNRNFKSNTINSDIQGCLIEEYPLNSGFCTGSRFYFEVMGNRFFCKKINKDYAPSYIPTKIVKLYNEQKSTNSSDTLPITYIGYMVSSDYDLLGVYAVHMTGGNKEWISDLSELAYTSNYTQIASTEYQKALEVTVKPKSVDGVPDVHLIAPIVLTKHQKAVTAKPKLDAGVKKVE